MATKPLTSEAIALTEKKMDMTLDDIIKMSGKNTGQSKKPRASNKVQRNVNQDRSLKMRQYLNSRSTLRQGVLAQRRTSFQGNSFPLAAEAARKAAAAPFRNRPLNHSNFSNWNRQRPGGQLRHQGNASNGGNLVKKQNQRQQQPKQHQRQQQPKQNQRQQQPKQNQRQQQHHLPVVEVANSQRPKTLDSLFANMKEQRMRALTQMSNGGPARGAAFSHMSNGGPARGGAFTFKSNGGPTRAGGANNNQPRQPWLRGRFGSYRY